MVNKAEKPREVKLSRGPILPSELVSVLTTAWGDPKERFNYTGIAWGDNHTATITELNELEPIEDAEGIRYVHGKFSYEDKSVLDIWLTTHGDNTIAARGAMARQRQSTIAQLWAGLPRRGRLNFIQASWVRSISLGLLIGPICSLSLALCLLAFTSYTLPVGVWAAVNGTWLLLAICLHLAVRASPSVQAHRSVVVLDRPAGRPLADAWTIAAGILGLLALITTLVTYLFPRR